MKNSTIFFVILLIVVSSCKSVSYYQVYKAQPVEKVANKGNALVYEDENVMVSYDLFNEGGDIGFKIQNLSNDDIYLNLERSYFILNGIANRYYQNRIFSSSSNKTTATSKSSGISKAVTGINYLNLIQSNRLNASSSVSEIASTGQGVSFTEEPILCIPKNTSKFVKEFSIAQSLFRDCDLLRFPTGKGRNALTFTAAESPLKFSNRIVYFVGNSGDPIEFENGFFVTEIINYNETQMFEKTYETFCGQKSSSMSKFHRHYAPDRFYLKYSRGIDSMKH
jgi:hypothetical protein